MSFVSLESVVVDVDSFDASKRIDIVVVADSSTGVRFRREDGLVKEVLKEFQEKITAKDCSTERFIQMGEGCLHSSKIRDLSPTVLKGDMTGPVRRVGVLALGILSLACVSLGSAVENPSISNNGYYQAASFFSFLGASVYLNS